MIKSWWVKILIKGEIMGKISLEVNGNLFAEVIVPEYFSVLILYRREVYVI